MSTDLKLHPATLRAPGTPPNDVVEELRSDPEIIIINYVNINGRDQEREKDECPSTPTSAEHRIPALTSPPPAPRKRRSVAPTVPPCKRRLQFDLFDNDQEIQDFFASSFAQIQAQRILKRRCLCT